MNRYVVYGLSVESDIELLGLISISEDELPGGKCKVIVKNENLSEEINAELDGVGKEYIIGYERSVFRNKYGYYLIQNGNEICYEAKEDVKDMAISSFIVSLCMSMVLLQRRTLTFHCSALAYEDEKTGESRAILICGNSGAGKSSLTRQLLSEGYKLMADDIAAIHYEDRKATVYPTFPAQKLCRNEVEKRKLNLEDLIYINEDKDKFLVPVTDMFVSEPRTLKSLFFIIPGEIEEVTIKKLSGLEQLAMIHHNLFLKRLPGDWENDKEYMNLCLKIAGACETYAVGRPKNGDSLQVMADKVRELA